MRVKATRLGYYNHRRIKEGATFTVNSENDLSASWMENLDGSPVVRKPGAPLMVEKPSTKKAASKSKSVSSETSKEADVI